MHLEQTGMEHVHSGEGVDFSSIFVLCVVMYGGIGLMWLMYLSMSKTLSEAAKSPIYVALICITWCSMSVGMHTLNKTVVSLLAAPALCSMTQMVVAVLVMGIASGHQLFSAPRSQLFTWMVVPVFFAAMLGSSFYTYEYISLSLLTIVRNLTPLVVLPIERAVMPPEKQPKLTATVVLAIVIMLIGAMVYGHGVEDISVIGVSFAVANMLLAVSDRVIQRRLLTNECKDLLPSVCTLMNNTFGMFPTLLLATATHEMDAARKPENLAHWHDLRVLMLLCLSGFVGIGICYLGFECQRAISATSFFVLQNMSKVAVVSVGIAVFADPLSTWTLAGLALSIGGSFLYGKAQMAAPEAQAKAPSETTTLIDKEKSTP